MFYLRLNFNCIHIHVYMIFIHEFVIYFCIMNRITTKNILSILNANYEIPYWPQIIIYYKAKRGKIHKLFIILVRKNILIIKQTKNNFNSFCILFSTPLKCINVFNFNLYINVYLSIIMHVYVCFSVCVPMHTLYNKERTHLEGRG